MTRFSAFAALVLAAPAAAESTNGKGMLPALAWLEKQYDIETLYDPNPPAKLLEGRLNRAMCEKRVLPDTFMMDQIDWFTYGEKQGEWLQRYAGLNKNGICWGEGDNADKWFDDMLAAEDTCNRPWMVYDEADVPKSTFEQFTQEAPAVLGLDPLILEFCRNITHDSRSVPHVNDPFWKTWKAAGMPPPEKSMGSMNILEHNLLSACSAANRNILRVSAMAQAKTSWDMCKNVEWVVCAAKGKLPKQGKTMQFATPPGVLDGNFLPTYREYRSNIMQWSSRYEIDILAYTFYLNEVCFLSELCDNADELWTLKRGESFVCKHSAEGEQRLRDSLLNAYNGRDQFAVARMLQGGHAPGGGHGTPGGGHQTTMPSTSEGPPESVLSDPCSAGEDFIKVEDASGFKVGDIIIISKGLPNAEQAVIRSIDLDPTLFLEKPLVYGHATDAVVETEAAWIDPCATVTPGATTAAPTTAAPVVNPCAPVTAAPVVSPCAPVTVPVPTPAPVTAAPVVNPCATATVTPEPATAAPTTTEATTKKPAWVNPCAPTEVKVSEGDTKAKGISLLQRATNMAPLTMGVLGAVMAAASVGMFMRSRRKTRSIYQKVQGGEQAETEVDGFRALSAREDGDGVARLLA